MNTVGKPGRLGEHVKCVVSVSMLTEGWDATTVTHVLGVRAFGTQLLCEQVVGRGLRRMNYEPNDDGMFDPEYAEVYGVPFSFIPTAGTNPDPKPPKAVHRVRAMEDRARLEITFPRVMGYRFDLPADHLTPEFTDASRMTLSTQDVPSWTLMDPIAGESAVHELELRGRRLQEVAFVVAKATLDGFLTDDADQSPRPWLFPQLVEITKRWIAECVYCKDGAFPQMLLLTSLREEAASKIYSSIVVGTAGQKRLLPILRPYDPVGSTNLVGFDTTKNVYRTDPDKCHLNYVVADTKSWEQKMAETLEEMREVVCYVKNQGLGFLIPYVFEGDAANYMPDFIVRYDDGRTDPLNLIVEVSGQPKKQKQAKVATARDHWVPAVNNYGGFGRWAFIEITDPWDAANLIRASIPVTVQAGGD
jgi:type III restriction enzyme